MLSTGVWFIFGPRFVRSCLGFSQEAVNQNNMLLEFLIFGAVFVVLLTLTAFIGFIAVLSMLLVERSDPDYKS